MTALITSIRIHEKCYKETGFIGVYDHVLLKELIQAADHIEAQDKRIVELAAKITELETIVDRLTDDKWV